jgi:GrpB-like predicted nucleotidyltransferase (UPF0157 family)
MDERIEIANYTSQWVSEYKNEEIKIKSVLGSKLIQIEHIGSTSVEMLGAKPIIDIMCGVINLNEVTNFVGSFEEIGYEFVWHKEFPERRFFRKGRWRAGTHHLHFYEFESVYWNNNLLFRDYLRKHADTREAYYQLKIELAKIYPHDRVAYTNGKNEFIMNVIKAARS